MHRSTKRVITRCIGLLAYASFGFSLAWLLGFLTNFAALPVTVDRGPASAAGLAVAVDLLLITVFGIQHSAMARRSFKKRWTRFVPPTLERSVYVLISSAVLLLLCLAWQPLPAVVWEAESVAVTMSAWTALGIGLAVLFAASFQIDHWELLGLRQTWNAAPGTPTPAVEFTLRGFYRFVRHPIYVGWLLLFWITPHMSVGHLLLAAGMTVYTLIAIRLEEQDLISEHGRKYLDYRDDVPALVPVPKLGRRAAAARKALGRLPIFAGALLTLAGDGTWAAEPGERLTLTVDGRDRTVVLAPTEAKAPERLVLMLHGAGGDAERIRHFTARGLERQAAAANWIVAYPEGVEGTWNDCRRELPYPARTKNVDDVGFLSTLIESLRSRHGIAARDVIVAGFSNGGQMAIRLALEQPHVLGSIAVVAAQLPAPVDSICTASIPTIRSLWVNGSGDPFIPLKGGPSVGPDGSSLGRVLSLAETIRAFLPEEVSSSTPARRLPEMDDDPATQVVRRDWTTADGLYLRQYVLHGSGHVVPQRELTLPAIAGHAAGDVDLGEILAAFVTTGSRQQAPGS